MIARLRPLKQVATDGSDELEQMFRMTERTVDGTTLEVRLDRTAGKVQIINRSTGNVVHAFGVNNVKP